MTKKIILKVGVSKVKGSKYFGLGIQNELGFFTPLTFDYRVIADITGVSCDTLVQMANGEYSVCDFNPNLKKGV